MADVKVSLSGLELDNPIIPASGTFGFGYEFADFYDINILGSIALKGTTAQARYGNPLPRIAECTQGLINSVGLQNPGVEHFIEHDLAWLRSKTRVIANVAGSDVEEYGKICARLDGLVDLIELNISCPNVRCGGMALGIRPENVEEVTRVAKRALTVTPLIVKLSPNVESIAKNAQAAEAGGADCLSLVNTFTGLAIDIERARPVLANNTGGVSGAGIKPIALRMVYEASRAVSVPVIGMGGIVRAEDAIEFLMAGATAVQVACPKIIAGLETWCESHGVSRISELTGTLRMNG